MPKSRTRPERRSSDDRRYAAARAVRADPDRNSSHDPPAPARQERGDRARPAAAGNPDLAVSPRAHGPAGEATPDPGALLVHRGADAHDRVRDGAGLDPGTAGDRADAAAGNGAAELRRGVGGRTRGSAGQIPGTARRRWYGRPS